MMNDFGRMSLYMIGFILLGLCAGCSTAPNEQIQNQAVSLTADVIKEALKPTDDANGNEFAIDLSPELHIRQIEEGVFEIRHDFPWPANSLLVEMANGEFVWAGSTYTPEAAVQVLHWLEDNYAERKLTAINTGYHVDNAGANAALIAWGIPVYGSDLSVQLLKERGEDTRRYLIDMLQAPENKNYAKAHTEITYLPPTQIYPIEEGLTLKFGEEQVQVYYPGPSQAPDKVVVYFPQRKILFGSCMILSADQVGNTAEANIESWISAIENLKQFDVEIVVPGHGERLDAGLVEHTLEVLRASQ